MREEHVYAVGSHARQIFTRKAISITFNVVNQDGSTGSLTLEEGHRIRATINNSGMGSGVTLSLSIEGMTPEDMARLSQVGNITNVQMPVTKNQSSTTILVKAGTYGQVLPVVFFGMVTESFASFEGGSSVFTVKAITTGDLVVGEPTARSYNGGKTMLEILHDICLDAGLRLVDHGGWEKYGVIQNHYAEGSALDQIQAIMDACKGTFHYIPLTSFQGKSGNRGRVAGTGELHVWGPTYRETHKDIDDRTPLISAKTGMIGYPQYNLHGLKFSCIFRSDIDFFVPVKVESGQMPAGWDVVDESTGKNRNGQIVETISDSPSPYEGLWVPFWISHDLSSEIPNGPWLTNVECQRSNTSQPISWFR